MALLVVNDTHLGVNRTGGTTPASSDSLRGWLQRQCATLIDLSDEVLVYGDLFDTFQIPVADMLSAYITLSEWLNRKGRKLYLLPGNHDLSKNSANMSSFELMARLLTMQHPDKVRYIQGGEWVDQARGLYGISHVPNQDIFDLELSKVPDGVMYLFLHVNVDNALAGQADHSLNITRDQARDLTKRGVTIVVGHEHQGREIMGDKVIITGNPFPSSVSDCLRHGDAQADGTKRALLIDGEDMELVPTWSIKDQDGGYREVDWRDLASIPDTAQIFVRVAGKADASEAAEVIKEISKLRQRSDAYVITNAVKVGVVGGDDEIEASIEEIKAVSVIDILLEMLDEPQQAVVRELMKD